jgi:thiamine-phosphate pyrophosphorylase
LPRGLYAIADATYGDPGEWGRRLIDAGVRTLQLRAKGAAPQEVARWTRSLVPLCEERAVVLIVNDHPGVAIQEGATGAHLGQDDGPLAQWRAKSGRPLLLGRSTHDLDQVRAAAAEGADYIGFGPVFGSRTHPGAGSARGLERLAEAVRHSPLPVVAIGGIEADRLPALRATGLWSWAVIRALLQAEDVAEEVRRFSVNVPPPSASGR